MSTTSGWPARAYSAAPEFEVAGYHTLVTACNDKAV